MNSRHPTGHGYIAELQAAVGFTREIGLTTRRGFTPAGRYLSKDFCGIVQEWARLNICPRPDDQIAGRCLRITVELLEFLAGANIPAIYTLGWMSYHNEAMFRFNQQDVRTWLEQGLPDRNRLDMHAWITLGSGEIIDPSWMSTLGVVRERRELIGAIIVAGPENDGTHQYHPVVVDTPIVERLKLLPVVQDVMQYLQATV